MSSKIKHFVKILLSFFPGKRTIIFESNPDVSDNTYYVFREMISRQLNKKFKFVWILFSSLPINHKKVSGVRYIKSSSRFLVLFYSCKARCFIFCNRYLKKVFTNQFSIHLQHGNYFKNVKSYCEALPQDTNYILTTSNTMSMVGASMFNCSVERFVPLGFPRNDELKTKRDIKPFFNNKDINKIVAWYPTLRQNRNSKSGNSYGSGHPIPIIWDKKVANKLDSFLKENNVLLVVKIHPAQDLSFISENTCENILFIDDSFFNSNNISSYCFISNCDALITDYSTVYYDYLLCDKPIGLIWEDVELFSLNPGFAVDPNIFLSGGEKIYSFNDLINFLNNVVKGFDKLQSDRRINCQNVNKYDDSSNTIRVVDFIIAEAKL